ncbi:MAG: site-specific DNA-methyltransferase [Actinomycetota bacterium]
MVKPVGTTAEQQVANGRTSRPARTVRKSGSRGGVSVPASTATSSFGVGRREGHDASAFYSRFSPPELSSDETVNRPPELIQDLGIGQAFHGSIEQLRVLPENSVALVVTSPPYFVGKDYEVAVTGEGADGRAVPTNYLEFLDGLRTVFAECRRVLEPGGRIAVNVANLGRKPYRSLSADVIAILQDDLGLLLRGEVIWEKAAVSSGSCAWGSFAKASNPVLRDMTERVVIASKGRFSRALSLKQRRDRGLPHRSSLTNDEFVDVTRDVWRIDAESATRIGHPAPFPIELPRRLIELYTYEGDLVVDPFVGSGTTLVAAARTGRIGVGFDTEDPYVELTRERLAAEEERLERFAVAAGLELTDGSPLPAEVVADLSFEDRQDHYLSRAVAEGRKVDDIARRCLEEAGFSLAAGKAARHPSGLVDFTFRADDGTGPVRTWVEVTGAFTVNKPGLQRVDAVWRLLGRLHAARAAADPDQRDRFLILTPSLPRPGSPADQALRSVGPEVVLDVIELYDPAGQARLRAYAADPASVSTPGFWASETLAR